MACQLRASKYLWPDMMQKLQQLPIPLRVLAYVAAALVFLALAAGVGVMAALTLGSDGGSPGGARPDPAGSGRVEANAGQGNDRSEGNAEEGSADASDSGVYSKGVAAIQNGSVEASLDSNDKLLRYDSLTADDVEKMKTNYSALKSNARRVRNLAPPAEYKEQHRAFVLAVDELRDADELAYRLAADPASATQANFEAYDRHMDRATAYLRRSNELLGKDHKTTGAAQEVSLE
jgi:hypothetical protein